MNSMLTHIEDQIIFQMGLNLRLYQEIEQMMKRLITISSQTVHTYTQFDEQSEHDAQPQINLWSERANVEKATLGNLLMQVAQTQNEPKYKEHHEMDDAIQISVSYHIPLTALVDMPALERDFQQLVYDRNKFIHNYQSISNNQDDLLRQLKVFYQRAKQFKNQYLIPCETALEKHIDDFQEKMPQQIQIFTENWYTFTAYSYFEEIYHQHKRADGWAVWATIMREMQALYPYILNGLRQERLFPSQQATWCKIVQEIYPQWQFLTEQTAKGGQRLLVKINNNILKLKNNQLVRIEQSRDN